jgi:Fur family ferric uptake transcriptional regulator
MESGRKGEARTHSYEDHRHEPPHLEHFRSMLQAYMVKKGLRSTDQRRLIVETFFQSPNHVSIEELLAQVRAQDAKVGYATVYRTLKLLAESGVAFERRFGDGLTRYELADDEAHHDHLICVECGSITEFEEPRDRRLRAPGEKVPREERAESQAGNARRLRNAARYSSHKHEMYGGAARRWSWRGRTSGGRGRSSLRHIRYAARRGAREGRGGALRARS